MKKYQGYDELDEQPTRGAAAGKPKRGRRASLIGGLAVLVGFAAVAVAQRDKLNGLASYYDAPFAGCLFEVNQHAVHPYQVALGAASLAVVALLLRRMTGRTRAGLPVFALVLAGVAAGTYRYEHSPREVGSPERWVQNNVVEKAQQWWAGHGGQPPAPPPAVPVATPDEGVPASTPAAPATKPADGSAEATQVPGNVHHGKSGLFGL